MASGRVDFSSPAIVIVHRQSVMCLTADSGVASSIPAIFHTFMEIDLEIISTAILLPSADSRRVVVSYKMSESMCTEDWLTA